jgi:flagellar biosynthetic protein FliR
MLPVASQAFGSLPGLQMQGLTDQILQFMAMMLRIGAFLMAAPFFGSRMVALPVRVVFGVALTFFVFGRVQPPSVEVLTSPALLPLMAQEIAIGIAAGLVLTILFSAVSLAGEKIAATSGLSFAAQIDPQSGGQTPVVSQIFVLFLTMLFLSLNGHLVAIRLVLASYETLPVGGAPGLWPLAEAGVAAAGDMFAVAAAIMLPVAAVLLMMNLAIGLITKSAPQLNLFSFGFPITLIGVFVVLFISTWPLAQAFARLVQASLATLGAILGGSSG